jgi:ribosomal protein L22
MGTAPQTRETHEEAERSHRIAQQASVAQTLVMNRDARVEKTVAQTSAQDEEGMATPFLQVGEIAVTDQPATARWIPASRGQIAAARQRRTEGLRGQAAP